MVPEERSGDIEMFERKQPPPPASPPPKAAARRDEHGLPLDRRFGDNDEDLHLNPLSPLYLQRDRNRAESDNSNAMSPRGKEQARDRSESDRPRWR